MIEAHHFFFGGYSSLWELKTPSQTGSEEKQYCFVPDEKSHGLGTRPMNQDSKQKWAHFFRRFWEVKEARHSETISSDEKCN